MKLLFWKKDEEKNTAYVPYEEIDSKKTSRLGYFFLILMVVFGIWQGNQFLAAVQESVDTPERNSYCAYTLASYADINLYSYEYSYGYNNNNIFANCLSSTREMTLGLPEIYKEAATYQAQLIDKENQLSNLNRQKLDTQRNKNETLDEYQAALLEGVAEQENTILDPTQTGVAYINQKESIASLDRKINQLQSEINTAKQSLRQLAQANKNKFDQIEAEYSNELMKYQFIQFLISLILVAPLFYFVWIKYHNAKRVRSEYTIIWGGAVATFGFILAQILLVFIYEILPKEFIKSLLSFLAVFEFVWTLLYFFSFILVPLFFGILIYFIQKKLYNKKAVLMRTLKSGHCPGCSLKLTPDMNHCPICGYTIKVTCSTCGHKTLKGGRFCSICNAPQQDQS